jgi:response regulator of citrate/malate metabolism
VVRFKSSAYILKGQIKGRPRKPPADIPESVSKLLPAYKAGEIDKVEYAKQAGISRPTLYKYLRLLCVDDASIVKKPMTASDVPVNVKELYPRYKSGQIPNKTEFAKLTGITRKTIRKYIRLLEEGRA